MLENLKQRWDNCSSATADNNLRKLEKTNRTLKYEKDKYFERMDFGHTTYLKKIKDVN